MTLEKLAKTINDNTDQKIEKLAGIVKNSFVDFDQRMDQKFDKVDQRFDRLELSVNRRFFESNDQLHGLQDKVARVENILKIG